MNVRRYLVGLFGTLALGLGVTLAFNALVDPYDCNHLARVRGFNAVKTRAVDRVGKSITVLCHDYDAMSFGTSRVGAGIPRHHPAWEGYRYFDFSFAAATIGEVRHAMEYAHRHHKLKRVYIGLDYFMFNYRPFSPLFYDSFMNPARMERPTVLDLTLSLPATRRSLETLGDNFNPLVTGLLWQVAGGGAGRAAGGGGGADGGDEARPQRKGKRDYPYYHLFRARLKDYVNKAMMYGAFRLHPEAMEDMRRIVAFSRAEGIDLRVGINPAHAMMMEAIRERGLWAGYEDWKRELARICWGDGSDPVPLYDFTGYNEYTTESPPYSRDAGTEMQWYYEVTHFKDTLGARVLTRMFGPGAQGPPDVPGFGMRLTPASVEAHLADIRAAREPYVRTHPVEMGWLAELTHTPEPVPLAWRRTDAGAQTQVR